VQVFLIRHAKAVDETKKLRDWMRYLSPHGRDQASKLGERLRWHDCAPTHVWTSPLVRAVQTAELVLAGLQSAVAPEVLPALAPEEAPKQVIAAVKELWADKTVVLVGHEPGLSAVGELLIGTRMSNLAKAEAVRIIDGKVRWRFPWDAEAPIT
jgi:phosphohistidine phosphatase